MENNLKPIVDKLLQSTDYLKEFELIRDLHPNPSLQILEYKNPYNNVKIVFEWHSIDSETGFKTFHVIKFKRALSALHFKNYKELNLIINRLEEFRTSSLSYDVRELIG
jgi:hypothetical protein